MVVYFCLYASSVNFRGQFVPIFVFSTNSFDTASFLIDAFSTVSKKHGFSGNFLVKHLKNEAQAAKLEKSCKKYLAKLPEGYRKLVDFIMETLKEVADNQDGFDYDDNDEIPDVLNYCIFVEKPDKTDYFPIVVMEAEDADVAQECFEDFVELASEEGFDARLLLASVPEEHLEMLVTACQHNLEAVPELKRLTDLFLDIQGETDNLSDDFNPEWN
jgi:hypothetical protein